MERLQKVIAQAGICSRRKAEELILDGKFSLIIFNSELLPPVHFKIGFIFISFKLITMIHLFYKNIKLIIF